MSNIHWIFFASTMCLVVLSALLFNLYQLQKQISLLFEMVVEDAHITDTLVYRMNALQKNKLKKNND